MPTCPTCGGPLEPDVEDSSKLYCIKCNYGWRLHQKVHVLTEDPKESWPGRWELHYGLYTTVTKETCSEIEELKKGDKIRVTTLGQKVIGVERLKGERVMKVVSLIRLNKAEIKELIKRLEDYESISSIELSELASEVRK